MSGVIGIEWLNSNSLRNYPLSQSSSSKSSDSSLELPDNFLLDMKLAVPYIPAVHPSDFYISGITVYPQGFILEIGCQGAVTVPRVAVSSPIPFTDLVEVQNQQRPPYTTVLKGVASSAAIYDFSQVSGAVVIGDVSSLKGKSGTFVFTPDGARLESTVVSMGTRRISGLRIRRNLASGDLYRSSRLNRLKLL